MSIEILTYKLTSDEPYSFFDEKRISKKRIFQVKRKGRSCSQCSKMLYEKYRYEVNPRTLQRWMNLLDNVNACANAHEIVKFIYYIVVGILWFGRRKICWGRMRF